MNGSYNRRIHRLLVVGVGSIGERHVRCFLKSGRARVSICEVNAQLCREVGERYSIDTRFCDLSTALAEPHDAAVVAVPADLHVAVAQQAAAAGIHLLIEKPLSVVLDGIDALQQAVERANLTAAVAYVYRAHPALAEMREAIRADSFGSPVQLAVTAGQNFPTYRPAYRDTYYASRHRGGGAIQDALTHLVNAAEWLVGPVDRVVADAEHKLVPGVEVEDVVNVLARHGSVIASYTLNQYQAPNELTISVVCERGTTRFEYQLHRWREMLRPEEPWQDHVAHGLDRDTVFARQADAFLDAIEGKRPPLCSFAEGLQSLRVNLAILSSIERGGWQSVREPLAASTLLQRY